MPEPLTESQANDYSVVEEYPAPKPYEASGISVLVVGAGVAGLMAALECWRQGHIVKIIERAPSRLLTGDGFTIGPTVIRGFRHWPQMAKENEDIAFDPWISFHKLTGEEIRKPAPISAYGPGESEATDGNKTSPPDRMYRHSRPKFHKMLNGQLETVGLSVSYGCRAVEYFEDEASGKAGVTLEDGKKMQAEVVIAADGVGSKSTSVTMGSLVKADYTGNSIYRAALPTEIALTDPVVVEKFQTMDDGRPVAQMWMGEGVHAVFTRTEDEMTWVINYPDHDRKDKQESWSRHVDPETVIQTTATVEGWPDVADRLIRLTPREYIHDSKLMWREPQPCWTSPSGRIVQVGDAAHTFLPSSGNGATQGMEDAISLATCLRLGGRDSVQWATRIHNKLRYERVSCLQMLGIYNHVLRDQSEQSQKGTKGKMIVGLLGSWIWLHDPEQYAVDNFAAARAHLADGRPFVNTNIPPGYVYEPWTIGEVLAKARAGDFDLQGDWD